MTTLKVGEIVPLAQLPVGSVGEFVRCAAWWSKKTFVVTDICLDGIVCNFIGTPAKVEGRFRAVYRGRGEFVPAHIKMEQA